MNELIEAVRPYLPLALTWVVAGALGGAAIGWIKNRLWRGVLLGATLGPIGWLVVGLLEGAFRECPACSRPIRVQARVCPHCHASVVRVEGRSPRSSLKGSSSSQRPW